MPAAIEKKSFGNNSSCGDECACWENHRKITLCIVDGLGHGTDAEIAAKAAIEYVGCHLTESIPDIFSGCNGAIHETRGVAMGLIVIDKQTKTAVYAGIGNTRSFILGTRIIRFSSNYGIVGGGYRRLTPETVTLPDNGLVIMYTDGIDEMFDISIYSKQLTDNIALLAQNILKDYSRSSDDAAVMVFKLSALS